MENTSPLPEHSPAAYPTIQESWGAFGWLVLITVIVSFAAIPLSSLKVYGMGQHKLWLLSGASKLGMLLTILWLRRQAGQARWPGVLLQELPAQWQLFAAVPVVVLAQALLLQVLSLMHLPNWFAGTFQEIAKYPVLMLVGGCLVAPILEETLFRGILLKGLLRNYRPAVAIGQSALLFGLMHFNPAQSVAAMLIGVLLGWLYYRTHSLGLCISIHAGNNLLAYSFLRAKESQSQLAALRYTSWHQYWLVVAAAGVVLGGILWWVQRSTVPTPAATEENLNLSSVAN